MIATVQIFLTSSLGTHFSERYVTDTSVSSWVHYFELNLAVMVL